MKSGEDIPMAILTALFAFVAYIGSAALFGTWLALAYIFASNVFHYFT